MRRFFVRASALGAALTLALLPSAALAGPTTYTYDQLGRVKTVTYADGSMTTYAYDPGDNRTQVTTQRTADFVVVPIAGGVLIFLPPQS